MIIGKYIFINSKDLQTSMRIKDMPDFTKPDFKLKQKGVKALDTAELLAVILRRGGFGENAIDLSNRLLKRYNLNNLPKCTLKELTNECKGDEIKALQITSLCELIKRYNKLMADGFRTDDVKSAKDVFNLFKDDFANSTQEEFYVVLLDAKNKVIRNSISKGILTSSIVHPREIFREAIRDSANSIILVHNHPSGDPTPSQEDLEVTEKIINAGELLGIKVLDHVIVGDGEFWSWKEHSKVL